MSDKIDYRQLKRRLVRYEGFTSRQAADYLARARDMNPNALRAFARFVNENEYPTLEVAGTRFADLIALGYTHWAAFGILDDLARDPLAARQYLAGGTGRLVLDPSEAERLLAVNGLTPSASPPEDESDITLDGR